MNHSCVGRIWRTRGEVSGLEFRDYSRKHGGIDAFFARELRETKWSSSNDGGKYLTLTRREVNVDVGQAQVSAQFAHDRTKSIGGCVCTFERGRYFGHGTSLALVA